MNEKDRELERLQRIVLSDEYYDKWRKFYWLNSHRIPLYPGSKIRDKSVELMQEFLADSQSD